MGNSAKIGAGSVLLRSIPSHATAVGVPAKIIGRTAESDPADDMDNMLHRVSMLGRKPSTINILGSTMSTTSLTEDVSSIGSESKNNDDDHHGTDGVGVKHNKTSPSLRFIGTKEFQAPPQMTDGDDFCVFREYTEIAYKGTPKDTVNIMPLAVVLHEEGVPQCTLGLCFFEMDHKGRGYLSMDTFLKEGPEVVARNCGFSIEKSTSLVRKAAALVEECRSTR